MERFENCDSAMLKLIKKAGDDERMTMLVKLALEALPYDEDEAIATKLLFSILLHDDLAETLNGSL